MKKIFISLSVVIIMIFSCKSDFLDESPKSAIGFEPVFSSESGLQLYTYSLYNILPSASDIYRGDNISDYGSRRDITTFLTPGAFSANESTGWDWGNLRNINHFLLNNNNEKVPLEIRLHYNGLARFFRAWFYFEKVKRFGDVPWIGKPLEVDDPTLFNGRDSRVLIVDSIIADLNYAITHLKKSADPTRSIITRDVANAFLSRVALFEGSFRKYHTNYNLASTANHFFEIASNAAKAVIDNGTYSIYTGSGPDMSYRDLFISEKPISSEIILAWIADEDLNALHDANWQYTSSTTGVGFNLTRDFVNTYLRIDGTPHTDNPDYKTMIFPEEVKNRDKRLKQTIRMEDYTRVSGGVRIALPPRFDYTNTGYHPIKWTQDDMIKDTWTYTTSSVSIIRYAEVLLNFAEAKAELETITDDDWYLTIGQLRSRAGITEGINKKPTKIDSYIQETYFPEITDPVILEIRRERGIELVMEGFRFYDLVRWKKGKLMEKTFNGLYVPELNLPLDLNEDGQYDVVFYKTILPDDIIPGVEYLNVADITSGGQVNPRVLSNDENGEILWFWNNPRVWEEKHYLYPIPESDRLFNPALGQNPGW